VLEVASSALWKVVVFKELCLVRLFVALSLLLAVVTQMEGNSRIA
jgi:hypothetical protein